MSNATNRTGAAVAFGNLTDDQLAAWSGFLMGHAQIVRALDAELEREHGLPLSSYDVLIQLSLAYDRRLRMFELADAIVLSRSGLTRLVDRLVALGYVRRNACADDGRGSYAELTEAGAAKFEAARRTHLAGVREFFLERLSDEDQRALGDAWDKVLPRQSTLGLSPE
jgi:DNA-binding MarR family transcriptional regulator